MLVRRSTKFAFKSKVHVAANRLHSALRSRRCLLLEDGHSILTFESLTRRLRGSPLDRSRILKFRRVGLAGVSQMIFSDSTDSHALVCARSEIAVLAGALLLQRSFVAASWNVGRCLFRACGGCFWSRPRIWSGVQKCENLVELEKC